VTGLPMQRRRLSPGDRLTRRHCKRGRQRRCQPPNAPAKNPIQGQRIAMAATLAKEGPARRGSGGAKRTLADLDQGKRDARRFGFRQ
jgi:hypothetical protein